jgi:hypothetical protein
LVQYLPLSLTIIIYEIVQHFVLLYHIVQHCTLLYKILCLFYNIHILSIILVCHSQTSFMTYHQVCHEINTTGVSSGAGTVYPSGTPEFTLDIYWGSCYSILSFRCMVCKSLFVPLSFFFWPLCCLFFFFFSNCV